VKKISSFTFTSETVLGDSTAETGKVSLSVTGDPLEIENMKPGDIADTTLTVTNDGTIDALYYLSADWKKEGTYTTARMATILANRLMVTVTADPDNGADELYAGTLAGLLDQPTDGRPLSTTNGEEDLLIEIELPADVSNIVQGLLIAVDFVFVAEDQPEEEEEEP
jgi:DNA/RNA endonuclease YhcR with UshA esterase domain